MSSVTINGKLAVTIDDEELDSIVINHLRNAVEACYDCIDLDEREIARGDTREFLKQDIDDHIRYIEAMNIIIEYFGGIAVVRD